jgi:glycosyltransferase involved in cell wall biosynthesis
MKKLLFLIHDLGQGGAEKVLVNLVNHMDPQRFDITVAAMFGGGVNEKYLAGHVKYRVLFPFLFRGNSHIMKLLSPAVLHRLFFKEHYDVEISYLEGPSARVISGCPDRNVRLVSWIHIEQHSTKNAAASFRTKKEAFRCYSCFDRIVAVSETVKKDFETVMPVKVPVSVLYNTVESGRIQRLAGQKADVAFSGQVTNLAAVGKLVPTKGIDRLLRIVGRLTREGYGIHLYLLGTGPEENRLRSFVRESGMENAVTFLGYQDNPYRYVAKCDLYVCSSFREGFSTAATEALIVGTPVCTTKVSGMEEMLGRDSEWGLITENSEEALYRGIRKLLDDPALLAHYRQKAKERGQAFSTERTVRAVEDMLLSL